MEVAIKLGRLYEKIVLGILWIPFSFAGFELEDVETKLRKDYAMFQSLIKDLEPYIPTMPQEMKTKSMVQVVIYKYRLLGIMNQLDEIKSYKSSEY